MELDLVIVDDLGDDEADDDEVGDDDDDFDEIFLGSERKALIFKEDGGDATRSYSSMRLARSSSEVIETRASRSSVGN